MYYYTFDKEHVLFVVDHMYSLDIEIVNLALLDSTYTLTTSSPIPVEQMEHLFLTEV
mgnify:CR=1 FL=1